MFISHWLFNGVIKKNWKGGWENWNEYFNEGREWRVPGLLYVDDPALCGESEGDFIVMEVVLLRYVKERM